MPRLRKPLAPPTEKHRDRKREAKNADPRCTTCGGSGRWAMPDTSRSIYCPDCWIPEPEDTHDDLEG